MACYKLLAMHQVHDPLEIFNLQDTASSEAVGEGVFGSVVVVVDKEGNKFAIKQAHRDTEAVRKTFQLEVQVLRMVDHPNIVKMVAFDLESRLPKYAMEALDTNLLEVIKLKGKMPFDGVLRIMNQLFLGLDHLHRRGIVHRDLKPENVMLIEQQVKLVDFGASHIAGKSKDDKSAYIGTRWYRPPEHWVAEELFAQEEAGKVLDEDQSAYCKKWPADPAQDVFAGGCIFYELVTKHPLFPTKEHQEIFKMHIELFEEGGQTPFAQKVYSRTREIDWRQLSQLLAYNHITKTPEGRVDAETAVKFFEQK